MKTGLKKKTFWVDACQLAAEASIDCCERMGMLKSAEEASWKR